MKKLIIKNGTIISDNKQKKAHLYINNGIIEKILDASEDISSFLQDSIVFDASEKIVIPGIIDDQVHFRESGLTHKGYIYSEAKAAIAGGVTSFMDMPNVKPPSTTIDLLEERYQIANNSSLANYSFYFGATNDNLSELQKLNPKEVCGIKVFMGSSTGNMLVDNTKTLENIFETAPLLIATHCEDEQTIQNNLKAATLKFGNNIPFNQHPVIRSVESCYLSSAMAVELATKYHARLHILHLTSEKEMGLFDGNKPLSEKKITTEVCTHHLWFNDHAYSQYGSLIKCNPAIKTENDRIALIAALNNNKLDIVASDHAPHPLEKKNNPYLMAPAGLPTIQHTFNIMFELYMSGQITLEKIVEKMCHHPAITFKIERRGFIREGYFADIAIIDTAKNWTVEKNNILYQCGWSPFESKSFQSRVTHTFVNGHLVYDNGNFDESQKGKRLTFNR